MINPLIAATVEKTKTAADAVSLAIFASGCILGQTKSMVASIDVLISSVAITSPNKIKQISHSKREILSKIPAVTTIITAKK